VVGVPGQGGHARVVAAVTLLPGAPRPDFDRLLEDLLPAHARPGVVHVLDTLPRNTISDKVLKVELRRQLVTPAGVA
jgi:acyl-coenzyme A synthetase/AMP-(fatty) acid ligase